MASLSFFSFRANFLAPNTGGASHKKDGLSNSRGVPGEEIEQISNEEYRISGL
jgi:hypothetical protein